MSNDGPAFVAATAHTDDKFGLADRLRDSAALIKEQIGGEEGDAVFFDLDLLADEIEEMEGSFEGGNAGFLSFVDNVNDPESKRRDLLQQGVGMLNQAVQSATGWPGQNGYHTLTGSPLRKNRGKKRQQANKK